MTLMSSIDPAALFEALTDGIIVLDQQGMIRHRNSRWQPDHEPANGNATAWAEGQSFLASLPALLQDAELDVPAIVAELEALLRGHRAACRLSYAARSSGAPRWFELTIRPFVLDREPGAVVQQRDVTHQRQTEHALQELEERFRLMTETSGDTLYLLRYNSLQYDYLSPAITRLTGYTPDEIQALGFRNIIVKVEGAIKSVTPDAAALRQVREADDYYADYLIRIRSGELKWIGDHSVPWRTRAGELVGSVGILTDISERKQREEMIRTQAELLVELSIPLLPISDEIVVVPLIGVIDTARLQQLMQTLLADIALRRARVAILDITGVPVVDTQVAHGLIQTARAVRLLGAQVVLTGIRPEVAQALVGLGTALGEVRTCATLQAGIAYALADARD